jgi:hypothetical protein
MCELYSDACYINASSFVQHNYSDLRRHGFFCGDIFGVQNIWSSELRQHLLTTENKYWIIQNFV